MPTDVSIDYAKYLVEISDSKKVIIDGERSRRQSGVLAEQPTPGSGLIKNVEKQVIDFSDLKEKSTVAKMKAEVQNEMEAIDQHFVSQNQWANIQRGNGY